MKQLLVKRFFAFLVDYFIIALYAAVLFALALLVFKLFNSSPEIHNPFVGQLVGFFTLTLPVFTYFFISEKSKWKGSIGKRRMKIEVETGTTNPSQNIFTRNILKFLPWEIAHTGVHWVVYYSRNGNEVPIWVWVVLMIPQAVVLLYFLSIIYYKGESSVYDKIAKTKIIRSA